MTRTASWDVNEEYWNEDETDEDLAGTGGREPVSELDDYADYGAEIESSRPTTGERDLI